VQKVASVVIHMEAQQVSGEQPDEDLAPSCERAEYLR
jgi:hypothetical protein